MMTKLKMAYMTMLTIKRSLRITGKEIRSGYDKLGAIQNAMEDEMKRHTLADLREGMRGLLAKET